MVHGLFEVGDVVLVDLGDGLMVLGGHRETAHVRVYVHGLDQAGRRFCNLKRGKLINVSITFLELETTMLLVLPLGSDFL